jgi:signal transduction histidine kinase
MSLWPRSLFGRVAAVLLAGLAAAYAVSLWSVMRERQALTDSMMRGYVVRDVASSVAVLDRVPAAERAQWLQKLARPNYRFEVGAVEAVGAPAPFAEGLRDALVAQLGARRVADAGLAADGSALLHLRLDDGSALTLVARPPSRGVSAETAALLLLQLALVGACVWWSVRLATRPLQQLAQAASRLGQDPGAAPLPEQGPTELREAAAAFNTMQRRIADHMGERLRILAAVSHDLQTPITRMRVRTELLPDAETRSRLQADLREMQALVDEGLAYARTAHAAAESPQRVDLQALLDALVCDQVDAGHRVTLDAPQPLAMSLRVQALRRVVGNLVDNAVKFAGAAEVSLQATQDGGAEIAVRDRGPGIPEAELAAVVQPFYRLEHSRSRDTGGSGLGLAIADQLSRALGAQLLLRNRTGGGLEAVLRLPKA